MLGQANQPEQFRERKRERETEFFLRGRLRTSNEFEANVKSGKCSRLDFSYHERGTKGGVRNFQLLCPLIPFLLSCYMNSYSRWRTPNILNLTVALSCPAQKVSLGVRCRNATFVFCSKSAS